MGDEVKADVFAAGDKVDASGVTKGHGYTGVIKRWNQHRLKGNARRRPCAQGARFHGREQHAFPACSSTSTSQVSTVSRTVTIQNLEVVRVDVARNCILVKGAIPGVKGSVVTLKTSVKA